MWPFKRNPTPAPYVPEPQSSTDWRPPAVARATIERFNKALAAQPAFSGALDDSVGNTPSFKTPQTEVPDSLLSWYAGQRFIGFQVCAAISQHWLVDKACTMPARDAIRHGFEVQTYSDTLDLPDEQQAAIEERLKRADRKYMLRKNMQEFVRMGRVFGIRVAFFKFRDVGPEFYENPFNIDGVTPGSYEGIVQVDPYWCTPMLSIDSAADPSNLHFYEPEWWAIRGKKYHRSHLIIFRNGEVPDILKPMYLYGGVSVPQRIYERVYAAERTANEAPQLAMTKRTMVQKTDLTNVLSDPEKWLDWMNRRAFYRDNYGTQVIDTEDEASQFDTSLADLDAVIMTQYQIVAAAAGVPATKLLGTTPKGFNATGAYEAQSYHEELETIQANDLTALVNRHHQIVMRSEVERDLRLAPGSVRIEIDWNPVDSPTALEYSQINKTNADTDQVLVNVGAIDAMDVRNRLRGDNSSGYTDLAKLEEPATDPELDSMIQELIGNEAPQDPPIAEA